MSRDMLCCCNQKDWWIGHSRQQKIVHTFIRHRRRKKTHTEKRNKRFISVCGSVTSTICAFFHSPPRAYYSNCKYTVPTDELNRADVWVLFFLLSAELHCLAYFFHFISTNGTCHLLHGIFSVHLSHSAVIGVAFVVYGCCCCLLSWDELNVQRAEKIFSSTLYKPVENIVIFFFKVNFGLCWTNEIMQIINNTASLKVTIMTVYSLTMQLFI